MFTRLGAIESAVEAGQDVEETADSGCAPRRRWAGLSAAVMFLLAGCGAASLAQQRASSAERLSNGVVCVRPAVDTNYQAGADARLGLTGGSAQVTESFSVRRSARGRCLSDAEQQSFRRCVEFSNGLLTRDEYIAARRASEARCEGLSDARPR